MKPARIVILAVAIVAAGLAGLLAMRLAGRGRDCATRPGDRAEGADVNVLVSSANLAGWLAADAEIDALDGLAAKRPCRRLHHRERSARCTEGACRAPSCVFPIFEGEPIRAEKIADSGSADHVVAPACRQARRCHRNYRSRPAPAASSSRMTASMSSWSAKAMTGQVPDRNRLSNVRVLAIDQQIQEKDDGSKAVVGTTATLELTPDQTKVTDRRPADGRPPVAGASLGRRRPGAGYDRRGLSASGDNGSAIIQVIKSGSIVSERRQRQGAVRVKRGNCSRS